MSRPYSQMSPSRTARQCSWTPRAVDGAVWENSASFFFAIGHLMPWALSLA